MRLIGLILSVSLFLFLTAYGAESEWLGEYVGGEIPGYEILKSSVIIERSIGGPTGEFQEYLMLTSLAKTCKDGFGGKALVNVRFVVSVGEVSFKKEGQLKVISPGIYGSIYGDCVLSVRKKK